MIVAITMKKDGKLISISDKDQLLETKSFHQVDASHSFRACCFAPTEKFFYTAQNNPDNKTGALTKWDATTGKAIINKTRVSPILITALNISPNGQYIVVGNVSGDIIVLTHQLSKIMHLKTVHQLSVTSVAIYKGRDDSLSVVSTAIDSTLVISKIVPNVNSTKTLLLIFSLIVLLLSILYQFFNTK